MEYEIKLDIREQRMALIDLAKTLYRNVASVAKKRSWRASEKAMASAAFKRQAIAVLMAIDALDIEIAKAAGNQAVADAGRYK